MPGNLLYYGDNLDILRRYIKDESVDLVYLDPPFNSNQTYNVLFKEQDGSRAASQIQAFEDTWRWDQAAAAAFAEVVDCGPERVARAMQAFRLLLGENDMLAYLSMMAPRLVELQRVLKPSGGLFLHCDSNAGHHLKLLLDAIFGPDRFVNEIVWKRSSAHSDVKQGAKHFGRVTDAIFFYAKGAERTWNQLYVPYDEAYIERDYRRVDEDGRRYRLSDLSGPGGAAKGNPCFEVLGVTRHWRYSKEKMARLLAEGRIVQTSPGAVPQYKRYLDEMPGLPVQNLWTDIPVINNRSKEKLGYPTQKPEALLERIITAASNEGDTILDAFCGCGTAVATAQRLRRRWIGIDITFLAIAIIRSRLRDAFGSGVEKTYQVVGEPVSLPDAEALAQSDRHEFQRWAVGKLAGRPVEQKKGKDRGIDGRLYFQDAPQQHPVNQVIISVKSGNTGPADVRDLRGVIEREKAAIGVMVTLQDPTRDMRTEAATAGFYESRAWRKKYPRLQLLTVEELLAGDEIAMPPRQQTSTTFKKAPQAKAPRGSQGELFAPDDEQE